MRVDARTESIVRSRAEHRCEYCLLPQHASLFRFHVDHVIARQHGGQTLPDNLALACGMCNRHKGPNLSGVDPLEGSIVRLFNPRAQRWSDHFTLEGSIINGFTPAGRATVNTLKLNHVDQIDIRQMLNANDPPGGS